MQVGLRALAAAVLVAVGSVVSAHAQSCHGAPSNVRVFIDVEGVRSNHGFVVANIYGPDKRRFLEDNGWLDVWRDPAKPGTQTMCLYMPAAGSYALVMFHDANANGDLDQGPFGIPLEGFGFSNNVRPFLMAPSLKSASFFAGPGDTRLQIRLHYP